MFDITNNLMNASGSHHRLDSNSAPEKHSDDEHSTCRLDAHTIADKEDFGEWKPVSSSGYDYVMGKYFCSDSEEENDDDDDVEQRVTKCSSVHDHDSEDEIDTSIPKATPIDPVRVQKKQELKQVFARLELRFGDILKCVAIILALVLPFHDYIAEGFNSLTTRIAKPISASMQQNVDGMLVIPVPTAGKSVASKPASPVVHPAKYLSMVSVKQKASSNGAVHHKAAPPTPVMIEVDPTTPRHAYQSW